MLCLVVGNCGLFKAKVGDSLQCRHRWLCKVRVIVLRGKNMSKNTKLILIVGGIIIVLLFLVAVFWGWGAGWSGVGWGIMGPGMMGGFGGGWFMAIVMIVIGVLNYLGDYCDSTRH
jgi:sterol desaturase/sphingolipid hydroxylase (fatty acid hydroxylase superfamily)